MKTLGIIGAGDLGKQIAYYAINDHHYDNVVWKRIASPGRHGSPKRRRYTKSFWLCQKAGAVQAARRPTGGE